MDKPESQLARCIGGCERRGDAKAVAHYALALEKKLWPLQPADIRAARQDVQMTQAELAQRVGVGTPHISKIERGQEKPSPALQVKLADILGEALYGED